MLRPSFFASVRCLQITMALCFCFYFLLVAINNCLDYQTNFSYVKHVMAMDTTWAANRLRYRAIHSAVVHNFVYLLMILWQLLVATLMGLGSWRMIRHLGKGADDYRASKGLVMVGFNLSILLWFYGFIIIGGEWFSMWQSNQWNGQDPAYQGLIVNLLASLLMLYPESEAPSGKAHS